MVTILGRGIFLLAARNTDCSSLKTGEFDSALVLGETTARLYTRYHFQWLTASSGLRKNNSQEHFSGSEEPLTRNKAALRNLVLAHSDFARFFKAIGAWLSCRHAGR